MDEVAALLAKMCELEPEVYVYGPAPESAIRQLEAVFGSPMPPTYRAFLSRFGGFSILEWVLSGITEGQIEGAMGRAITDTTLCRATFGLPAHFLVVEPDPEAPYCLDFSRVGADGERPVVCYQTYRHFAGDKAPNFEAWLVESLLAHVEAWSEDAEPYTAPDGD